MPCGLHHDHAATARHRVAHGGGAPLSPWRCRALVGRASARQRPSSGGLSPCSRAEARPTPGRGVSSWDRSRAGSAGFGSGPGNGRYLRGERLGSSRPASWRGLPDGAIGDAAPTGRPCPGLNGRHRRRGRRPRPDRGAAVRRGPGADRRSTVAIRPGAGCASGTALLDQAVGSSTSSMVPCSSSMAAARALDPHGAAVKAVRDHRREVAGPCGRIPGGPPRACRAPCPPPRR